MLSPDRSPVPRRGARPEDGADVPTSAAATSSAAAAADVTSPTDRSRRGGGGGGASSGGGVAVAAQRLQRELIEMMSLDDAPTAGANTAASSSSAGATGIAAFPKDDDLFVWNATVTGPRGSVYEGIEYALTLRFKETYPFTPPVVHFVTPCYHPNVDLPTGTICLDILKEQWSAVLSTASVLLSIQALLECPNLGSALNPSAAAHWNDRSYVRGAARRHAGVHWRDNSDDHDGGDDDDGDRLATTTGTAERAAVATPDHAAAGVGAVKTPSTTRRDGGDNDDVGAGEGSTIDAPATV